MYGFFDSAMESVEFLYKENKSLIIYLNIN